MVRAISRELTLATAAAIAASTIGVSATACPVCVSDTGVQLRAMIAADPLWHVAVTLAPVPLLLAAVALVRLATPFLFRSSS